MVDKNKKKLGEEKLKKQNKEISTETRDYFISLGKQIEKNYEVGRKARALGLDPVDKVEAPLALTMAAKVVRLVSSVYPQLDNEDIIERLLELEKKYGALENSVSFQIAREIAEEKFCKFDNKIEAMDAGIRVGFAYTTLGVVSSPIEGFTGIKEGERRDGKKYLKAFFSGPIRSAGTTASCVVIMLIDYIRQLFGYEKYDPSEEECKRLVTEVLDYHERVTNLQYCPSEEESMFIAKNLPIQICGDPTSKREVSNYKDLPRVETNFIRGGMCLIVGEGVAQKAPKGLRILKGIKKNSFKIKDWEWLDDYVELHEKQTVGKAGDSGPTYIKDLVAGRPVFGHPQQGFRFRYGRSRGAGFSAVSLHPATMGVTEDFIGSGTQLKIEKPTKGCAVTPCDSIEGPIVKFEDESVKQLGSYEETKMMNDKIEEIIYAGDILFPLGDVINRNAILPKPGYVEEWWYLELLKKDKSIEGMDYMNIDLDKALELSKRYNVSLYPKYIYYWNQINGGQFLGFLDWLNHSRISEGKLLFPYNKSERERFQKGKRTLELLGIVHTVSVENVVLDKLRTRSLLLNLGVKEKELEEGLDTYLEKIKKHNAKLMQESGKDENGGAEVLKIVNDMSELNIRDKAGEFIGSRMGRPEKAKLRKLTGSPSALFPVSKEGGRLRSVNEAVKVGSVKSDFPFNYCEKCKRETIYRKCEVCGGKTKEKYYCRRCKSEVEDECEAHRLKERSKFTRIDMSHYYEAARAKLGYLKTDVPELIKGVRGTSSEDHSLERLEKGILRSKYNLTVNKDGTIRYDMTELPLSHFKPVEIGTSVEKLKELGYLKDYKGEELKDENQILEMKPHDILLPCNEAAGDEKADDVFMNIANFLDEMLEKLYGLPKFYNIKKREDLVGVLGVTMAPHNCAGVICRIIGFSKVQGLVGTPYLHAAMRRDCFDFNTYIPIKEKGVWKNRKIGEVVEKLNPKKKVDNFGTKEKQVEGTKTLGVGKVLEAVDVNNFTKHTKRPMLKIKTASGKEISVTENHKFLIKGKLKRASNLEVGDEVSLPKKIEIDERDLKEINLLDYLRDDKIMIRGVNNLFSKDFIYQVLEKIGVTKKQKDNFYYRDSYPCKFVDKIKKKDKNKVFDRCKIAIKRDNVNVPVKIKLSKELLEVIGLYIAEGYATSIDSKKGLNQVYISASNKKIRGFIKKTIKESFGLLPSENKKDRVTFSSKVLYRFFVEILECGDRARNKRIPYLFLNLKLKKLAHILRGYFEGDGSAEKNRKKVSCDSISEGLLSDLEFCLSRVGIFCKRYKYKKKPGKKIGEFYIKKKRKIPEFEITKLIIGADFIPKFNKIGFLSKRKNDILNSYGKMKNSKMRIKQDEKFVYDPIVSITQMGEKESYSLEVNNKNHLVVANNMVTKNCDGDEAGIMMLLDVLINFSQKFLPSHRGGTQDAPLVLNGKIFAKEVDDQILDFELCNIYPLELYEKAGRKEHSGDVKIDSVQERMKKKEDPYVNTGFTHDVTDFNIGPTCSSYKLLPTMKDKVETQMRLCCKLRGVDQGDVARLIIDRHFMRDLKGNLRKFSQQKFRCSKCNKSYRRPPLKGKCENCGGNIIFTISYGSIVKYLEPALDLTENFNVPIYIAQDLKLTKRYIESIFGKDNEKQEALGKWF